MQGGWLLVCIVGFLACFGASTKPNDKKATNEELTCPAVNDLQGTPIDLQYTFDRLDMTSLSRLLAIQNMYSKRNPRNIRIPKFWNTDVAHGIWSRFRIYGTNLVYKTSRGDGSCLFWSVSDSLRLGGFTIKKIKENLDHYGTKNRGIYEAIMSLPNDDEYLTMQDIQRIATIGFVGFDPDVEASVKQWDREPILSHLETVKSLKTAYMGDVIPFDLGCHRFTSFRAVDDFYNGIANDATCIKAGRDLFNHTIKYLASGAWGYEIDIYAIETALNLKIVLISYNTGSLVCYYWSEDYVPQSMILLYYHDSRHFDVAGLVDMFKVPNVRNPRAKVLTSFHIREMPMALAIILKDDCRITKRNERFSFGNEDLTHLY
ncbi:Papain-like cysteine peptidase superfamily [Babesia duncani]|uniref:Papain-like cysteine peptidase superfamily n=1 Tax=Babesia duncani TaxID=323732 RepID=A0AAD9PKG4_9APIC|nr:Papain-like cysteine peptidase superfamily [Babesia duncani]